jgi:gamma-glutamylcyclotransferase (GGCT)/AIG2-like uncharacterized protein YtfP
MKIFAYGTLKKGGILHKHMDGAKYIRKKKLAGYVLYLAPDETYPLLYYTGKKKDVVLGEIWKIDKQMKKTLDKYEEGYVLKKLMDSPIMTYYPNFDITHICKKIPKDKDGRYQFNIEPGFYKGFYKAKTLFAA